MGYKQPFKKVGKVELGMKNQSKSGVYQIGSLGPDPKKDEEDSMFKAPSITVGRRVLRPEDFYDKPAAQRVRSTLAAESTDPETDAPAPIKIDEYGYSTNPDKGRQEAEDLSLGMREAERRPITEQETKFESQFGLRKFDNQKPFLGKHPSINFARSRRRSETGKETYAAWQKGPVAQRYQENVKSAQQQLEREKGFTMKGHGTTVKSVSGQLQDSANKAMSELQKKVAGLNAAQNINQPKTKKSTSSRRRRENVLETVGEAIGSLNPFKPRFGPSSKAGRRSTGSRWMKIK